MPDTPPLHQLPAAAAKRARVAMRIKKGQVLVHEGRAVKVLVIVSPSQIWVNALGTDDTEWVSADALEPYTDLQPAKPLVSTENEFEFERAKKWVEAFEPFKHSIELTVQTRTTIAQAMDASRRTVDRHFALYQLDPSPRGQLPVKSGPVPGASYMVPAIDAIIEKAIDEKYECKERSSIGSVVELARTRCAAAGLDLPCYNTVYARIKMRDRWKVARARHGHVRAYAMAGPVGQGIAAGLNALDFVQMDHAIVDVIVVDPETREEIGRPWITLAIDVATRCILGFYLTFDPPSQTSVALALEQCCCPKDAWLKAIGYEGEWIPFGLMKVIGWDNAKCFKNTNLITACKNAGIDPRFRRVRTPVHGAHIERYIGTFLGRVHLLKGTTFSNTKEREDYKSGEKAVMTLAELELWAAHEINGRYHNVPHSGLKEKTPLQVWDVAWRHEGQLRLPPIPADRRKFKLSLLPRVLRTVTREGVNRFGCKYWDEALIPLIGDSKKYWVSHDCRNISCVFLEHKGDYLSIPWKDRTRRPIALWELERAKRDLRKTRCGRQSETTVFAHLGAMYEIEAQAEKKTRQQRRDNQRRPKDDRPTETSASVNYKSPPTLITNPLEVRRGRTG